MHMQLIETTVSLTLENESEQAEWLAGEKRRELRGQRRKEGF